MIIQQCNGQIGNNGRCLRCGNISRTSTGLCTHIFYISENRQPIGRVDIDPIASYRAELKKKIEESLLQDHLKQKLYKIIDLNN